MSFSYDGSVEILATHQEVMLLATLDKLGLCDMKIQKIFNNFVDEDDVYTVIVK